MTRKKETLISAILCVAISIFCYGQNIGINSDGSTPESAAILDVKSSNKGMLVPRMTTSQRDNINNPAMSLLIFNTDIKCYEGYDSDEEEWFAFGCLGEEEPSSGGGTEGEWPEGYVHCGDPTEVVEVTNPRTGLTWMDRNLGASQVAQDIDDADAFGDLYQWGRFADGHQCRDSDVSTVGDYSTTDQPGHDLFIRRLTNSNASNTWDKVADWRETPNNDLWQGVNGINNPCPSGFRVPTAAELNEERVAVGGAANMPDFNKNILKLTKALSKGYGGIIYTATNQGKYWSSTKTHFYNPDNDTRIYTWWFHNSNSQAVIDNALNPRIFGASVRCIKDEEPTSGGGQGGTPPGGTVGEWPEDYVHCGDPTEVVEITNPKTGFTWMDRNLGASQVADSVHHENAFGDLFQWGRFADGHQCRDSELSDYEDYSSTDQPGHSKFIRMNNTSAGYTMVTTADWRATPNNDLWQGVNGINNPCPTGFRVPTSIELKHERYAVATGPASTSIDIEDMEDFTHNVLRLTKSGFRTYNGQIWDTKGEYWSSTINWDYDPDQDTRAYALNFTNTQIRSNDPHSLRPRMWGLAVRCIKDY